MNRQGGKDPSPHPRVPRNWDDALPDCNSQSGGAVSEQQANEDYHYLLAHAPRNLLIQLYRSRGSEADAPYKALYPYVSNSSSGLSALKRLYCFRKLH